MTAHLDPERSSPSAPAPLHPSTTTAPVAPANRSRRRCSRPIRPSPSVVSLRDLHGRRLRRRRPPGSDRRAGDGHSRAELERCVPPCARGRRGVGVCGIFADVDGVTEAVEDGAPNGGDGNDDGVDDADQSDVASLVDPAISDPTGNGANYVSIRSTEAGSSQPTVLRDVRIETPPAGTPPPPGSTPQSSLVSFRITNLTQGPTSAVARLEVFLPSRADAYFKFDASSGVWTGACHVARTVRSHANSDRRPRAVARRAHDRRRRLRRRRRHRQRRHRRPWPVRTDPIRRHRHPRRLPHRHWRRRRSRHRRRRRRQFSPMHLRGSCRGTGATARHTTRWHGRRPPVQRRPYAPGGTSTEVQVAGRGNVPADAVAANVNVVAINPGAAGFFTIYPCGDRSPGPRR